MVAVGTRHASIDNVLLHYHDADVANIAGVNVNRLDTYNAQIEEFNIFKERIDIYESLAMIQTGLSRSLSSNPEYDLKLTERMELNEDLPAFITHANRTCKSTVVMIEYNCDQDKLLDVKFILIAVRDRTKSRNS